ncbi:MAG: lysophospholipid acyltransferase family protein [Pseudanabaenaceae cyanobacterium bins.68]|nr:lysophospholipid acyltransferase family protein [Pseudanabaenaceae cyanobacterium bins.68]
MHLCFRSKIHGADRVPKKGALIIVSNHASDFDPLIVANCANRPVAFMAKEELFQIPVLSQAIKLYGAYPVKRGASDRQALRAAIATLEQGWATGIFLQGTRTADGKITDPKLGAALIAAKTQVPLIPVSIWGTDAILPRGAKLPRLHPVTIRIGELIDPPQSSDRHALEICTNYCAEQINQMHYLGR